jgi:hypothetical protein
MMRMVPAGSKWRGLAVTDLPTRETKAPPSPSEAEPDGAFSPETAPPSEAEPDGAAEDAAAQFRDIDKLLPKPSWLSEPPLREQHWSYENFSRVQLEKRYSELESDFRRALAFISTPTAWDAVTAERIRDLLAQANTALSGRQPNLFLAFSSLDLVERLMASLMAIEALRVRVPSVQRQLNSLDGENAKTLATSLTTTYQTYVHGHDVGEPDPGDTKFWTLVYALEESVAFLSSLRASQWINSGLQLKRLRQYRKWGFVLVFLLLIVMPLLLNGDVVEAWGSSIALTPQTTEVMIAYLSALALAVVGAAGAFISGLMQAQRTRIGFASYQEAVLNSGLRPIFGACAALLLYVFFSWQLIPGVDVTSAGAFVIFAFLVGFSERYFLRLLQLDTEEADSEAADRILRRYGFAPAATTAEGAQAAVDTSMKKRTGASKEGA